MRAVYTLLALALTLLASQQTQTSKSFDTAELQETMLQTQHGVYIAPVSFAATHRSADGSVLIAVDDTNLVLDCWGKSSTPKPRARIINNGSSMECRLL